MKSSLDHLSPQKQEELQKIVQIIKEKASVDMIILFGSFARGDWVSDKYKEGHITYEYQSDFDILLLVRNEKLEKNHGIWNSIETQIQNDSSIQMPVNLLVDTIHFVNDRILEGNYFYNDIKREGVLLYDSGDFNLSTPKALTPEERCALAQRDYDFWYKKAHSFLRDYRHNMEDGEWNNAAFHLHQSVEALFVTMLLVFTGYKPKTHNLSKIEALIVDVNPSVSKIFPKKTAEQRHLFELLRRAYVDARYKVDYKITREELDQLFLRAQRLADLVKESCLQKIATMC